MSSIIEKFKEEIDTEKSNSNFNIDKKTVQPENHETVSKSDLKTDHIIIKNNTNVVPIHGYTMASFANELGIILETAMHKAGVSSITTDCFGIFNELNLTPKVFKRYVDVYTGKEFFLLKSSNRMTEVFSPIIKALNTTNSDMISFPYLVESKIKLPIRYLQSDSSYEDKDLLITSLFLTPKEIDNLNYAFIKTILFRGKEKGEQSSKDLLTIEVDREIWKTAPYKV